jgi:hypothetical protein
MRAQPSITPMHRGQLPACSCRHALDGLERPSGRNAFCAVTPSTFMSPTRSTPGPWTEIRLGARAHHTRRTSDRAHAPPAANEFKPVNPDAALVKASLHR